MPTAIQEVYYMCIRRLTPLMPDVIRPRLLTFRIEFCDRDCQIAPRYITIGEMLRGEIAVSFFSDMKEWRIEVSSLASSWLSANVLPKQLLLGCTR